MQRLITPGTRQAAEFACCLACAVAVIVVMLLPSRPFNVIGWALYLASVTLFALALLVSGWALLQIEHRANSSLLAKALAALLAVFPGASFVWLVFHYADKIVAYFR